MLSWVVHEKSFITSGPVPLCQQSDLPADNADYSDIVYTKLGLLSFRLTQKDVVLLGVLF